MNYIKLKPEELKNYKQYKWFRTFPNPCYGFNVKMDVTEVVNYSKRTGTSFFINTVYAITTGLSSVDELRIREVSDEIRLYEKINPTFTVMTKTGVFENTGFDMIDDYKGFYEKASSVVAEVKELEAVKDSFNDSPEYADYYMTCLPWLSIEGMTHPLIDGDYASLSCPRVCWDKYRMENERYVMTLNVTVNHCFVDGHALSRAFNNVQERFDKAEELFSV